ncbi:MAG: hypothetical protein GHCLOJNM_01586 [bacterium]|nr:hypothetical protein [bacterium]
MALTDPERAELELCAGWIDGLVTALVEVHPDCALCAALEAAWERATGRRKRETEEGQMVTDASREALAKVLRRAVALERAQGRELAKIVEAARGLARELAELSATLGIEERRS